MRLIGRLTRYAKLGAAFVVVPVALLALAEGGLRVAGYGHSTRPFVARTIDGHRCHSVNFDFFRQFMPWWPYPVGEPPYDMVIPEKAAGSYRIAILGSSAAHGWYFPDFNFGRILEVMLKARFQEVRFEVYDLSYIAMNSHVMRYMAREAAAKIHPDLFVVYMGNNEIKGTLGILHAMNMHRRVPMDWLVRGFVAVSDLRLVQAGTRAMEGLSGRKVAWAPWQSTAGISSMDDARIAAVNRNYRDNLEAICDAARGSGAAVALCTLQRNLRDYPPDQSIHGAELAAQDLARWEELFEQGKGKQSASDWPGALELYRKAAALDAPYAELQFRMGTCLWVLQRFDEAHAAFVSAQENNFGLLSANAHINAAVKDTAAARSGRGVFLVDAAAELAANSPHETPGHDFFFDHVHFTFGGSYVLARAVFNRLLGELPEGLRNSKQTGDGALTEEQCKERLAYSPAEELAEVSTVIAYLQSNKADAPREDFVAIRDRLTSEIGSRETEVDSDACRRALGVNAADLPVRWRYVQLLLSDHKYSDAEQEARILVEQYPLHWRSHWALAAAQSAEKKDAVALDTAKFLRNYYADYPETWYRCGELLSAAGDFPAALDALRRAAAMRPLDDAVQRAEGQALEKSGRPDDALDAYGKAIRANPLNEQGYRFADALLQQENRRIGRVGFWKGMANALPRAPLAAYYLGIAHAAAGDANAAREALAVAGQSDPALNRRGETESFIAAGNDAFQRGDFATACTSYESAIRLRPDDGELLSRYGTALEGAGRFDEALAAYGKAITANPINDEVYGLADKVLQRDANEGRRGAYWARLADGLPHAGLPAYYLGLACVAAGDATRAREAFGRAGEMDPVLKARGDAFQLGAAGDDAFRRNDFVSACASYKDAVKLRADDAELQLRYGKALNGAGRSEEALATFLQAIALRPLQPEPYQELETLLNGLDPAKASATWRAVTEKHAESMQAHLHLARSLVKTGGLDEAMDEFKRALAAETGAFWVRAEFGRFLLSVHRVEEAVANLKEVLEKSPDMQYVRPYLVQAMLESNNPEGARIYADDTRARKEPVPVDISPDAQGLLAAAGQP